MEVIYILGPVALYLAWAVYDLQKQVTWLHKQAALQFEINRANGEFMQAIVAAVEAAEKKGESNDHVRY